MLLPLLTRWNVMFYNVYNVLWCTIREGHNFEPNMDNTKASNSFPPCASPVWSSDFTDFGSHTVISLYLKWSMLRPLKTWPWQQAFFTRQYKLSLWNTCISYWFSVDAKLIQVYFMVLLICCQIESRSSCTVFELVAWRCLVNSIIKVSLYANDFDAIAIRPTLEIINKNNHFLLLSLDI